jgi:hypothetical protein
LPRRLWCGPQAQASALFNRSVRVFPPPGLEAGANFFSRELPVSAAAPGRLYVGLCAPGRRIKGSLIRVYVAALAAGQTLYEKYGDTVDSFLTAVGYFSSLRELGGTRRLVDDDVRSRLTQVGKRGLSRRTLRLPTAVEELTSRIGNGYPEPAGADEAEVSAARTEGQPNTARCSSRNKHDFGRRRCRQAWIDGCRRTTEIDRRIHPGNEPRGPIQSRPGADRLQLSAASGLSHFEGFRHYHATFYRQVEALSVTPYSTGAIDRALTGVLVGAIRQTSFDLNRNVDAQSMQVANQAVKAALAALPVRAAEAGTGGPVLQSFVESALQQRLGKWWQRARKMTGGPRIGYQEGRDGATTALLKMPGTSEWTDFTVLNSLRDLEPEADFVFNDDGMDAAEVNQ